MLQPLPIMLTYSIG